MPRDAGLVIRMLAMVTLTRSNESAPTAPKEAPKALQLVMDTSCPKQERREAQEAAAAPSAPSPIAEDGNFSTCTNDSASVLRLSERRKPALRCALPTFGKKVLSQLVEAGTKMGITEEHWLNTEELWTGAFTLLLFSWASSKTLSFEL